MWFGQEAYYTSSETKGQRATALGVGGRGRGQGWTTEAGGAFLVLLGVAGECW